MASAKADLPDAVHPNTATIFADVFAMVSYDTGAVAGGHGAAQGVIDQTNEHACSRPRFSVLRWWCQWIQFFFAGPSPCWLIGRRGNWIRGKRARSTNPLRAQAPRRPGHTGA